MQLTERLSSSLTACFLRKGWITTEDIPYCKYILDGCIGKAVFLVLLMAVCTIFHCYKEALSFSLVLLAFRQRMGGWHASSRWLCQVLSIGSVIIASCFLGPFLSEASPLIILSINVLAVCLAFFLSPAYPPQLHFSTEEKKGNIRKKNRFLLILFLLQLPLVRLLGLDILIYTGLGLYFGIISVLIQRTTQIIGKDNEK